MGFLRLERIEKRYNQSVELAVDNLNFSCERGEFISILGPSGCGKTTTLRMIAGLEEITGGELILEENIVNNLHPKNRKIGLAFENYALYPPLNVYENIAYNLKAKKTDPSEIKKQVMNIADLMHVTSILDKYPKELSGGQKQRVNIARAIVRKPKVLLLDEPMSHLDGKLRQTLRQEIRKLHKEIGCTTILVTHDQLEAMSLADKLLIMNRGKLQQYDTPSTVFSQPKNEFVAGFIGDPPMNIIQGVIKKENQKVFFCFHDFKIPLSHIYFDKVHDAQVLKIGIRPHDIQIVSDGVKIEISVFENLGEEKRISVRLANDSYFMISSFENITYKPGDTIQVLFKDKKTHLFDEQGENILLKGKE